MYSFYSVVIVSDRPVIQSHTVLEFNLGLSAATTQNIPQLFGHYIVHTISYSLIFDISPYSNNLGMRILVSSKSANYTLGSFSNSYTISIL